MDWERKFPSDSAEDLACRKCVYMIAFTERNYAEDLEVLVMLGIEGLKQVVKLSPEITKEIFANTEDLANFHSNFADNLEDFFLKWTPNADITTIFSKEV